MTTSTDWTITRGNVTSNLDMLINELNDTAKTFEKIDKDGTPIGTGWAIQSFDKSAIYIFETKPMRGS